MLTPLRPSFGRAPLPDDILYQYRSVARLLSHEALALQPAWRFLLIKKRPKSTYLEYALRHEIFDWESSIEGTKRAPASVQQALLPSPGYKFAQPT